MFYVVRCDCGTDLKGQDEDEAVTNAIEHAREGHAMNVTREQVRALVERVAE
jgi:predicted small metal-binding protein